MELYVSVDWWRSPDLYSTQLKHLPFKSQVQGDEHCTKLLQNNSEKPFHRTLQTNWQNYSLDYAISQADYDDQSSSQWALHSRQ